MWQIIDWQLYFKSQNSLLRDFLLMLLACTILIWCVQFLWKRRNLYEASIKLPGPLALPFIGSAFYFVGKPYDIFGQITQLFDHYPGVFRVWFGTRLFYAVSDPKCFEILLTSPHALRKENLYKMAEPVTGHGLFSAISVTHWKRHRKIIMPTFNQKILEGFMPVFVEQSEILIDILEEYAGKKDVDIFNLVSRCTLDIICETAMGVQIKAQSTDSSFPKWVDRVMEIVMMRIFNIFYHSDLIFNNSPLGRDFRYAVDKLRSFTKKVLTEKKRLRSEGGSQNDNSQTSEGIFKRTAFLDLLIEINYEGKFHFTDDELLDETITFMIAGSDTTATTNCFTLTMLGMHQEIQEKVYAEILDVVGPEGCVELVHLPKLTFLERVIKETLRLFPLGSILVRNADENIDIGDCVVQKGCSIVFGILRAHRNEKYWPDPYKFDPDRFLSEAVAKRTPGAYIPFSYGPRNCIGLKYGMMAMKTLLATVVRKYHVYTTYKNVKEIDLKSNLVLRPKDGYKVSFELRKINA